MDNVGRVVTSVLVAVGAGVVVVAIVFVVD